MWDYDKLFAENNVIGLKALHNDKIFVHGVSDECLWGEINRVNWHNFKNKELKVSGFEIQYIIRLDEHGNVIEKLFDREVDMPKPMPELETGMFVSVAHGRDYNVHLGYVNTNNNRLVYQNGGWNFIDKDSIIEVYSSDANCFRGCTTKNLLWRSPNYQAYLVSKSN